jgi:hypothetical protein
VIDCSALSVVMQNPHVEFLFLQMRPLAEKIISVERPRVKLLKINQCVHYRGVLPLHWRK